MDSVLDQKDPELLMLINNKESGFNYRKRRQPDWLENYTLYRDKVVVNRLIQRQSVHIPLMKQTIRTLLKDVDDMPVLYFENLDNDKQAELFKNEYWKYTVEQNNMELQDIVDKRQVFLFGRSFDQWQIEDGKVKMTIQDPEDILVSRFTDPSNLHSSRFLIHTHIFKPLSSLLNNPDYDQKAIKRRMDFYATDMGLIRAAANNELMSEKNKKMARMGVPDLESPILGETYVELTMHFVMRDEEEWEGKTYKNQIFLYVEADNEEILMKKPLEMVIGTTKDHYWQTHYPYCSWADDLERQDFWSDAIADIVRTPNKVIDTFFSQEVENRTLKNYSMTFFDSTTEGFQPQTFEAKPWGFYPVPGKPADILQRVDIPDLSSSREDMEFIMAMIEKATGATATQQGAQTERQVTLGEVKLALGEAKERIKGMSKFYTPAWKQRGEMFIKLLEAGADKLDSVKIYKKGRQSNNIYTREITPEDWRSEAGYRCKVWSQDEKNTQDTDALQKLNAAMANMPNNPKLKEIFQRKLLEYVPGITPDEVNDIMELEKQMLEMQPAQIDPVTGQPVAQQVQAQIPQPKPPVPTIQTQV